MGAVVARFRKKKTPEDVLEDIKKDIHDIESELHNSIEKHAVITRRILLISALIYIVTTGSLYFFFYPKTVREFIICLVPLLIFPIVVLYLRSGVAWVYKQSMNRSKDKLSKLLKQRKKILEEVMNTETYKKAKEILEKYDPDFSKKPITGLSMPNQTTPLSTSVASASTPTVTAPKQATRRSPGPAALPTDPRATPRPSPMLLPRSQPPRRLVRPIFPPNRSYFDRLLETLIGDGPNHRYALICKNCSSHNGMALKDEFENLSFRCAYCGCPNARPRRSSSSSSRSASGDAKMENINYEDTNDLRVSASAPFSMRLRLNELSPVEASPDLPARGSESEGENVGSTGTSTSQDGESSALKTDRGNDSEGKSVGVPSTSPESDLQPETQDNIKKTQ